MQFCDSIYNVGPRSALGAEMQARVKAVINTKPALKKWIEETMAEVLKDVQEVALAPPSAEIPSFYGASRHFRAMSRTRSWTFLNHSGQFVFVSRFVQETSELEGSRWGICPMAV